MGNEFAPIGYVHLIAAIICAKWAMDLASLSFANCCGRSRSVAAPPYCSPSMSGLFVRALTNQLRAGVAVLCRSHQLVSRCETRRKPTHLERASRLRTTNSGDRDYSPPLGAPNLLPW